MRISRNTVTGKVAGSRGRSGWTSPSAISRRLTGNATRLQAKATCGWAADTPLPVWHDAMPAIWSVARPPTSAASRARHTIVQSVAGWDRTKRHEAMSATGVRCRERLALGDREGSIIAVDET